MSARAEMWVRGVTRRPMGQAAGRRITPAEKVVLLAIAAFYRDELACAYGKVSDFRKACGLRSDGYVRSLIAGLEEAGVVLRQAMRRGEDGSQTTNLYEFPLMGYAAEWPMGYAARQKQERPDVLLPDVSGPMCCAVEWPMRRAAVDRVRAARAEFFRDKRQPMGKAAVQMVLREAAPPLDCAAGPPPDCAAPSELYEDLYRDHPPHTLPSAAVDCAESGGKALVMAKAKARTTASANANATTLPPRGASGARDGAGGEGMSSGFAVLPKRERVRDMPGVEELDGVDAAWHAEVTRVMVAIGVSGKSLRPHVERALRSEVARQGCTIAQAGLLAEQRFNAYHDPDLPRVWYPNPREFFRSGLWLRPVSWKIDREARVTAEGRRLVEEERRDQAEMRRRQEEWLREHGPARWERGKSN